MKYIDLINEFWRQNTIEPFRPLDAMIYLYLLNQCNMRRWQNPFRLSSRSIELAFCITRNTVMEVRKRLQRRGLLTTVCRPNCPMVVTLTNVAHTSGDE